MCDSSHRLPGTFATSALHIMINREVRICKEIHLCRRGRDTNGPHNVPPKTPSAGDQSLRLEMQKSQRRIGERPAEPVDAPIALEEGVDESSSVSEMLQWLNLAGLRAEIVHSSEDLAILDATSPG